jgi:hypothetical protein
VNYNYIRFYQTALKRITPYFYAGGGYILITAATLTVTTLQLT